jgi:hypothetical protein
MLFLVFHTTASAQLAQMELLHSWGEGAGLGDAMSLFVEETVCSLA